MKKAQKIFLKINFLSYETFRIHIETAIKIHSSSYNKNKPLLSILKLKIYKLNFFVKNNRI